MIRGNRFLSQSDTPAKSSEDIASGNPVAIIDIYRWRHWLLPTIFILMMFAFIMRLVSRKDLLEDVLTYPMFLKVAMQADTDRPFDVAVINKILPHDKPTGFQARAMSDVAQAAGLSTTAERWLVHGLDDSSSGYLSQFKLCLLYWNDGERAKAREMCRNTRDSARYWLNRGYEWDQAGDAAEALAFYQMAAAIDPGLIVAWHQLGHALFAAKRYDEAILAYERVMALNPTPPADVFHSLSRAYLEADNLPMARDVANRGLMIYPMERVLYLVMADSYQQEPDLDTAESWYVRMLQRWPFDGSIWARRAEVAATDGRLHDAEEYYQEAVAIQPDDAGYWISLAAIAVSEDNRPLARDAYQKAMDLRPNDVTLWLQAGRYFVEAGWPSDARAAVEHVLELEPQNVEALSQLAKLNDQ